MSKKNIFSDKIFNFEDRLVRFAGECIFFTRNLNKSFENEYYKNQLIRSSGSSSLNFGESQGAITDKDVAKFHSFTYFNEELGVVFILILITILVLVNLIVYKNNNFHNIKRLN